MNESQPANVAARWEYVMPSFCEGRNWFEFLKFYLGCILRVTVFWSETAVRNAQDRCFEFASPHILHAFLVRADSFHMKHEMNQIEELRSS